MSIAPIGLRLIVSQHRVLKQGLLQLEVAAVGAGLLGGLPSRIADCRKVELTAPILT